MQVTELLCHLAKDLEDAIPDQVRVWSPDFKLMRVGHRLTSLAAFFRYANGVSMVAVLCHATKLTPSHQKSIIKMLVGDQ